MSIDTLIESIVSKELAMFVAVVSEQPAPCQQDPKGFDVFRSAQFAVWSEDTLASYLEDLERAESNGKNLMTLKYARMDNLIPDLHEDPEIYQLIDTIVAIEKKWQKQMLRKYPALMKKGRMIDGQHQDDRFTSFQKYLKAELETFSDNTLYYLLRDVREYDNKNKNMAESMYEQMVTNLGYENLAEAEEQCRQEVATYACRGC